MKFHEKRHQDNAIEENAKGIIEIRRVKMIVQGKLVQNSNDKLSSKCDHIVTKFECNRLKEDSQCVAQ